MHGTIFSSMSVSSRHASEQYWHAAAQAASFSRSSLLFFIVPMGLVLCAAVAKKYSKAYVVSLYILPVVHQTPMRCLAVV
jgi:hypothetical protein